MRRSADQSRLVKAFMESSGLALRSAQWHAKKQSPAWLAFLATRAAAGPPENPSDTPVTPLIPSPEDAPADAELRIERACWSAWLLIDEEVRKAAVRRDVNLPAYVKASTDAAKSFRDARRAREQADITAGRLIPAADVHRLRSEFLIPVRSLLVAMPAELGPRVSTFDPSHGIRECETWLTTRLAPLLDALEAAIPSAIPSPPEPLV
jgi:hypothetical protein